MGGCVYEIRGVGVSKVIVVGIAYVCMEEGGVELDDGGNGGGQIRSVTGGVESKSIVDFG